MPLSCENKKDKEEYNIKILGVLQAKLEELWVYKKNKWF
jgi:hypothetical protein